MRFTGKPPAPVGSFRPRTLKALQASGSRSRNSLVYLDGPQTARWLQDRCRAFDKEADVESSLRALLKMSEMMHAVVPSAWHISVHDVQLTSHSVDLGSLDIRDAGLAHLFVEFSVLEQTIGTPLFVNLSHYIADEPTDLDPNQMVSILRHQVKKDLPQASVPLQAGKPSDPVPAEPLSPPEKSRPKSISPKIHETIRLLGEMARTEMEVYEKDSAPNRAAQQLYELYKAEGTATSTRDAAFREIIAAAGLNLVARNTLFKMVLLDQDGVTFDLIEEAIREDQHLAPHIFHATRSLAGVTRDEMQVIIDQNFPDFLERDRNRARKILESVAVERLHEWAYEDFRGAIDELCDRFTLSEDEDEENSVLDAISQATYQSDYAARSIVDLANATDDEWVWEEIDELVAKNNVIMDEIVESIKAGNIRPVQCLRIAAERSIRAAHLFCDFAEGKLATDDELVRGTMIEYIEERFTAVALGDKAKHDNHAADALRRLHYLGSTQARSQLEAAGATNPYAQKLAEAIGKDETS